MHVNACLYPYNHLKALRDSYLYSRMEFSKIEDYTKARLNISASTTSRLIRLASYFSTHPDIEDAFLRRKITQAGLPDTVAGRQGARRDPARLCDEVPDEGAIRSLERSDAPLSHNHLS